MKKRLLVLSFVEGATVMAAELCGARLLSPVYGSSLFVWAAVMGLTLAALAGGYFFGGYLSHHENKRVSRLFWVLVVASLATMAMPAISYYIVPRISYLAFTPGVVLSTTVLLFFPIFFLGASSPMLIALQTASAEKSGKVSGTVYAVSTAGGICATFAAGFYTIPELGLQLSLLITGGLLLLVSIAALKMFKWPFLTILAAILWLNYTIKSSGLNALYSSYGILGHVRVQDHSLLKTRLLTVNDIVQSEMDLNSKQSVSAYVRLLNTLVPRCTTAQNALVLGLGAGLTSNLLQQKGYRTDGVEFDERIIIAARNYFYLHPAVNTICADARYFLNSTKKRYQVVLFDVFKAEEQPSHIATLESFTHLKNKLSPNALVLINWHGYSQGPNSEGTWVLYNTLVKAGFSVKLTALSAEQAHRNIVMVAATHQLPELPFELNDRPLLTAPLNTDNQPLLEKYTATANKAWRLSYLRYYQQQN